MLLFAASINECASLHRRSNLGPSEFRTTDKEIRTHTSVTFYDADQAFSLNQFRRDTIESQTSADMKRPKTAPLLGPGGEEKDKRSFEWPKVRSTFGYSSQDTLFPISINLLTKDESKKAPGRLSWSPDQDSVPLSPAQLKIKDAALEQKKKKKKLFFPEEIPKRYNSGYTEKQKVDFKNAKSEGQEDAAELFAKGGS